jgi:hypothetical protein
MWGVVSPNGRMYGRLFDGLKQSEQLNEEIKDTEAHALREI